uniref:Uncharacterized protein n=1 Tax=Wuchereria bancrofti TaxID=6293 RepID=A0AAF5Q677_WUCBA
MIVDDELIPQSGAELISKNAQVPIIIGVAQQICSPSGKSKRARVYQTDDVTHKVEWKPVEADEHSTDVRLFNQSIYESPFICNVGDPDLVTVRNMPEFISSNELFRDYTFERCEGLELSS